MVSVAVEMETVFVTFAAALFTVLSIVFILSLLFGLRAMAKSSTNSRLDTPEKAIEREKERYVDGEINLETFEDRVYQKIPIGDLDDRG